MGNKWKPSLSNKRNIQLSLLSLLFALISFGCKQKIHKVESKITVDFEVSDSIVNRGQGLYAIVKVTNLTDSDVEINEDKFHLSCRTITGYGSTKKVARKIKPKGVYFRSLNLLSKDLYNFDDTLRLNLSYTVPSLNVNNRKGIIITKTKTTPEANSTQLDLLRLKENMGEVVSFLQTEEDRSSTDYLELSKLYLGNIEDSYLNPEYKGAIQILINVIDSEKVSKEERAFRLWQLAEYYSRTTYKDEVKLAISEMISFKESALNAIEGI